ncbi:MAG: PaaI family thioesterase [Thermoanaerobaculia bacterium]
MDDRALQDTIWPESRCWGCGPANTDGLRIKSRWEGDRCLCRFQARPEHAAGPPHVVNGGVLATVVDCHSVWTAIAALYRSEGREMGSDPPIWGVTGEMTLRYLRPTPLAEPIELRARPLEIGERKVLVGCEVVSGDVVTVRAEVLTIRVPLDWLEQRRDSDRPHGAG